MLFTHTIATYLIFLAYINFTKFENSLSIVAVGHALRAFFHMKARQQAGPPREDSQK